MTLAHGKLKHSCLTYLRSGTVENGVNFKMRAQHAIVHKAQNFYDMFDQMMKHNQIRTELIESLRRNGGIVYMA